MPSEPFGDTCRQAPVFAAPIGLVLVLAMATRVRGDAELVVAPGALSDGTPRVLARLALPERPVDIVVVH